MNPIPQTPAEQQAAIEDATGCLIDGDNEHNKRVLRELFTSLARKAPSLWERIMACPACKGKVQIGTETFTDSTGEVWEHPILCPTCHADREEYAALIGM